VTVSPRRQAIDRHPQRGSGGRRSAFSVAVRKVGQAMSDEKTATKTIVLSDGTAVEFRELTKSEWERMERIKSGATKIGGETLTRDALLMAWTITRAVLSPPDITKVLLTGMEEGSIAEAEMIDLHNSILDFTAEQVLARVTPRGRA
jgi:hypothetical protein